MKRADHADVILLEFLHMTAYAYVNVRSQLRYSPWQSSPPSLLSVFCHTASVCLSHSHIHPSLR